MKKAFTLIEVLVVIAILGILTAALVPTMLGGTAAGRAKACETNMKNLATAVQTYGQSNDAGHYPYALSTEYHKIALSSSGSRKSQKPQTCYNEARGWISWYSSGVYSHSSDKSTWPTSSRKGSCRQISAYSQNEDDRQYALTNGVLWKYVNEDSAIYCCPEHRRKMAKENPAWSYVMNILFIGKDYGTFDRASRTLLFAELQFDKTKGLTVPTSTGDSPECDCALQYKGCGYSGAGEFLGINHKVGRQTYGHICFADGHCEKIEYPRNGISEGELQELTEWLCKGIDVSFDGQKYTKMTNDD